LTQSIIIFLENNFIHLGSKNFKLPGPDSKFPPLTINTSGHPNHMGFFLPSFPAVAVQNALGTNNTADISWSRPNSHSPHYLVESPLATNSSQGFSDPNSILEQQIELLLETVQKKVQSGTFSPRAQNSLKLINDLISMETPVASARTSTCESPSQYSW
jgi:hypothetical protein